MVNYTGFSITWNETLAGVTVEAPCTGVNLKGTLYNYFQQYQLSMYIHTYICPLTPNILQVLYGEDA